MRRAQLEAHASTFLAHASPVQSLHQFPPTHITQLLPTRSAPMSMITTADHLSPRSSPTNHDSKQVRHNGMQGGVVCHGRWEGQGGLNDCHWVSGRW
ncbi:hypothetical protein BV22DRAFT_1030944 [Leucogyrophana mollusca]|uniref:Uncharacterized protein n=1 Tax=Leucogyrophana mollusca TaxID=85980 RepID=A0ACB8BSQ0_9AGAM|nr:hypothetical protein BV22DRAFT_1030944 [Leucogyrophana mollusca]